MKGWNTKKDLRLLEEREEIIKENQEAVKAIENSWNMEDPSQIQIPQCREEEVPSSPKTIQQVQALQDKGNFIQGSQIIPDSF
ncbi:hypothetical protein O181_025037 [Austropuccinia psidii MF-1]|uniref:Uncharacterized protein n=1 Tax=Austropuccinia psidii MF-1 TaxID=1389203 RepID=A0A9Q3GZH8_9BASI|nr:hypothetical protein [Austropuccinia psidii MF-1]